MPDQPAERAGTTNAPALRWRRLLRSIHRDVGYLAAAVTVVYAVSGIAVNHIDAWNPSYVIQKQSVRFEPIEASDRETMAAALAERLGIEAPIKDSFRDSPSVITVFFEGTTVEANVETGVATVETTRDRPVFRDLNFLHLNHPRGLWTWIADVYAGALIVLAISGLVMLRGRHGFGGRGKWLFAIGLAIPVGFVVVLRYL